MTRRLGLKYLWIDSLCILQDSLEDWRHEGSSMAEIYSNSYITLAATNAMGSAGGFYRSMSSKRDPQHLSYTLKDSKDGRKPFEVLVWENFPIPKKNFVSGELPLLKRAWAYQERLLSPRTVHFADDMLYWECPSITTGETQGRITGLDGIEAVHTVKAMLTAEAAVQPQHEYAPMADSLRTKPEQRLRLPWYNIVRQFTRCELTFSKDTLPALQGVARRVHSERRCAYYAGLWEDTLCSDLLWVLDVPCEIRPHEYRAPSWSWASTQGGVSWPYSYNSLVKEVNVVSVSTTPAGDDPLGELTAGTLKLKGRSLPGMLKHYSRGSSALVVQGRTGHLNLVWHEDHQPRTLADQDVTVVVVASWLKDSFYLVLSRVDARNRLFRRLGIARHEVKDMRSTIVKLLAGHMDYEECRPYDRWESCGRLEEFTIV